MLFDGLVERVNNLDLNNRGEIVDIANGINIDENNFNDWVNDVFSDKVKSFNMGKLPYLIDELYKTTDKFKFMLCCMLLESTCDKLEFVTNLENYPLFKAKFETLLRTLVRVYDLVDNGIANCMALIILNNDPEFKFFDDELKINLIKITKEKLRGILNYLTNSEVNPLVYQDLEIIVDLACYMKDPEINDLIEQLDELPDNKNADVFIMKYKVINNMIISREKLEIIKKDKNRIVTLYKVMEELGVNEKYLSDVPQEAIAESEMIKWLIYPTELGSVPDKIELLGSFIFNNTKCFAFKFSKENFRIQGELLGVSGGYPMDKVSSHTCGYTFSKFEAVSDDWEKQALELVGFIYEHWKNRAQNQ